MCFSRRQSALASLVTAIAIGAAVASAGCGSSSNAPLTPKSITIETGTNPSQGPADAKVTIVEFSDFQNPQCGAFAQQTLPQILANYGDKVRFVFMNFPPYFDAYAQKAAEAGECAHAQQSFWPYHDLLFQNQQNLTGLLTSDPTAGVAKVVDALESYAAQLGLDTAEFNDCLYYGKMVTAVEADTAAASKAADDAALPSFGLPSFFINGNYLQGSKPYDVFRQMIDLALAAK